MAPPPALPPPGVRADTLLGGRYRLEHCLAVGGMAEVWEGTDEVLGRAVAVKVLHPHLAADPHFRERFRREAVAAARLSHPGVVAVFDTVSDGGTGTPVVEAVIMELVPGITLRQHLDRAGRLPVAEVVHLGLALCDALDAAHRAGIVHRDVKPGNILLTPDGRVLLTDFGIARAADTDSDLTASNLLVGTAKYVAPEQVTGGAVDGRADLYALGVVLYECLAGQVPFDAGTDAATALARLHRDPLPVRRLRPGVPRALDDLVQRLLARDPARRPPTAAAVRDALVRLDGTPADDVTVVVQRDPTPTTADPTPPHGIAGPGLAPPRERRWLVSAVVLVLVAVGIGVAGTAVSSTDTGSRLLRSVRDRVVGPAESATTAPEQSGSATTTAGTTPAGTPTIVGVAEFDPQGDGKENPARLGALTDGDPDTTWATEGYYQRSIGRKDGVGLVLQASTVPPGATLRVASPTQGWSVRVYRSEAPASDLTGWGEPVATQDEIPGDVALPLGTTGGRYVLLFITDAGEGRAGQQGRTLHQVVIDEVSIEG